MHLLSRKKLSAVLAVLLALVGSIAVFGMNGSSKMAYGDAYAGYDDSTHTLTLLTEKVVRKVSLTGGRLVTTDYTDLVSNVTYVDAASPQNEFTVVVDNRTFRGDDISTGAWKYVDSDSKKLSQNELQVSVTVTNDIIEVTKYYVLYPETSFIQEWAEIKNVSGQEVRISSPGMFEKNFGSIDGKNSDFYYMTGNGNYSGASIMKAIPLNAAYSRYFNSLDDYELQEVHGFYQDNIANKFMGVGIYNEFFAVHNRAKNYGFLQMFDYIGIWNNDVYYENGRISFDGRIAMSRKAFSDGESLTTAKSLTGFWKGDMDDMGNTVVGYQYDYKWDYTDEYTTEEMDWSNRQAQWIYGRQTENAFKIAQEGRLLGFSAVHIDDSWFSAAGDWEETYGDDFAKINEFVKKTGSPGMTVWSPIWMTYYQSEIAKEHPDWLSYGGDHGGWIGSNGGYGSHWNFAKEEVYEWALQKLTSMQQEWGSYLWRYDAEAVSYTSDGYNDMLAQSNNYYRILKDFKDLNPDAGIHGCSSGGHSLTVESLRYSDMHQITDGGVGDIGGYYLSMLFPASKIQSNTTVPVADDWRRSTIPFAMASGLSPVFTAITDNDYKEKEIEICREFNTMNKFLKEVGVKGRYSKTYRPLTKDGQGKEYLLQLMDGKNEKGAIFITRWNEMVGKSFTVLPKGLNASDTYTVSSWEGGVEKVTKTGAELMRDGVTVNGLKAGETIFFNLENRPFNGTDTVAPDAPETLTVDESEYLGYRGVELNWARATDDNFISHYNIYRNGNLVDEVYSGTFYFGLNGNVYDEWGVAAVDGDGNESARIRATSGQTPSIDRYDYTGDFAPEGNRGWSAYTVMQGVRGELEWRSAGMYLTGKAGEQLASNTLILGDSTVIIEWEAPRSGYVIAFGEMSKERRWTMGDGVNITLSHKYNELYHGYLTKENWEGLTYQGAVYVMKGDTITFAFDNNANDTEDKIFFSANIRYEDGYYSKAPEEIKFSDEELQFAVGKKVKLPVNVYPLDATAELTYEVVDGKELFELNADGTFVPKYVGSATVKVYSKDNRDLTDTISLIFYDEAKTFDSIRDYGSIQGYRNWSYKYLRSGDPLSAKEMSWDNVNRVWVGPEAFLQNSPEACHPGSGKATAREFVAPYSGSLVISASYSKPSGNGNGVQFTVYHNAQELYKEIVKSVHEKTFSMTLQVKEGDSILFVIDSINGDTGYDTLTIHAVAEYEGISSADCVREITVQTADGENVVGIGERVGLIAKTVPENSQTPIRWSIASGNEYVYYDEQTNELIGIAPGLVVVQAMAQDAVTAIGEALIRVVATNEGAMFDSKTGFSLEQGKNNWYYYTSTIKGIYKEIPTVKGDIWSTASWANIDEDGMHPQQGIDVVRAFKAPYSGKMQMIGAVHKASGGIGGDGVNVYIYLNGKCVYENTLAGNDSKGYYYDIPVEVVAGDMIYLVLNCKGSDGYDGTAWRHVNSYTALSGLSYKVELLNEKIASAPAAKEVTVADREQLESLMAAYEEIPFEDRIQVRGYHKLLLGLERIEELEEDVVQANKVDEMITLFIRTENATFIAFAQSAYNALSQSQKQLVKQYSVLEERAEAIANASAAAKVERMINAIAADKVTLADQAQLKRIAKAYGALTEEEHAYLSADAVTRFNQMNATVARLTDEAAAHKLIVLINSLSIRNSDYSILSRARFARDHMTEEQLSLVGEERLEKLQGLIDGTLTEEPDQPDNPSDKGGCGSVMISGMSGALTLLAGAAIVLTKKKNK